VLKQFKQLLHGNDTNRQKSDFKKMYLKPEKETSFSHLEILAPNIYHQVDILYLPKDKSGENKCIILIDVYNGICEALPLPNSGEIREFDWDKNIIPTIERMYEKSKYLYYPRCISADNQFNNKYFLKWCSVNKINFKKTQSGVHTQLSNINNLCRTIGRLLWQMQIKLELKTGKSNSEWVENLPKIIDILNNHSIEKNKLNKDGIKNAEKKTDFDTTPKIDNQKPILMVGTRVRIALTHPIDFVTGKQLSGAFRSTDFRWTKKIYVITDYKLIDNNPVLYKLKEENTDKIFNSLLPRERLQIV